jgi:Protein of unknown function (DUF3999)
MARLFCALVVGAGLAATVADAANHPREFALSMALRIEAGQSHYAVTLPAAVYEGVVQANLSDLRVYNAQSEWVPIGLQPRAPLRAAPASQLVLTPYALRGPAGIDAAIVRLERQGDQVKLEMRPGTAATKVPLLGYLIDTTKVKQPIRSFRFDLGAAHEISTAVRIEASDDLKSWQLVADGAPLLRLEASGERLVLDRVEFAARRARYFRFVFVASRTPVAFKTVTAEWVEGMLEPERHQRDIVGLAVPERVGEFTFDTRGLFPVERIRVVPQQVNSVAAVELLSRANPSDPWTSRVRDTVFRLVREGVETMSPAMAIPLVTDRYWLARVDQRGGGFGAGAPTMVIEWHPHRLVFVARGDEPYHLAFGNAIAKTAMLPIDAILPRGATVEASGQPIEAALANAMPGEVQRMAGDSARRPPLPVRMWVLWASIVAAVAMLAWMAWRLTRQLKTGSPPAPS